MNNPQFKRLEYLYLTALGCIALSIVISQVLIQTSIEDQQDDARVINVAGRQRMLSQKISKLALEIERAKFDDPNVRSELREALELWEQSHTGLLQGDEQQGLKGQNSRLILKMFGEIDAPYQVMRNNAKMLLRPGISDSISSLAVAEVLQNESTFLSGMDAIVFQYDREARAKVQKLKKTEYYLFFVSLFIILLELIFVFRPSAINIRKKVLELRQSEESSKKMANELANLYEELGKSYQDLEAVNIKPEAPSLYAKMDRKGEFKHLSSTFLRIMEYEDQKPPNNFTALLRQSGFNEEFITGLVALLAENKNWSGELRLITEPGDFVWLEAFIVPVQPGGEIKIIARNITEFKEAKMRSRELNKERIEKSVQEQQFRSSLILQGQEEERKRLSQELHDGVGQMMSAMKLLLEALTPSSKHMKVKLDDAKSLMKSIIQEVRRVSFNLTPSSLEDFGLIAAVSKFCDEIDEVAKAKVTFTNETRFINRLDVAIETNIYRIVQEAVNNAIKYAKANRIDVVFTHDVNSLKILIEDDGKGFDIDRLQQSGHFENAGHGIFNMRERTAYIHGTFNIDTAPQKGTRIFITLSLDKND
ncbi:MAG: type IV pili methyl-accepting chemotaxis transducer N-terminal domain-containing protein [Bacteroidota bacterium]